jgi:hypothetical protein
MRTHNLLIISLLLNNFNVILFKAFFNVNRFIFSFCKIKIHNINHEITLNFNLFYFLCMKIKIT